LVDALVQLSFAVHDVLGRAAATHDLSIAQVRLLGVVRDRTPPMTAIAAHLRLDRSSVTGLVDRAEQRGLVARSPSSRDARVTTVQATNKGKRIGTRIADAVSCELESLVMNVSTPERDRLVRIAHLILAAQAAQALNPSPRQSVR
jgi:DNA-binding MarR family transcriptional regulator